MPEYVEYAHSSLTEKMSFLNLLPNAVFEFYGSLSREIDKEVYGMSLLQQPRFFLRIRKGKKKVVVEALKKNEIDFEEIDQQSLSLKNGSRLDEMIQLDKDAVVQDLSSQHVLDDLLRFLELDNKQEPISVWDVCAASGGKSILLHDLSEKKLKLTVSDVRKNILTNLKKRMAIAGISLYRVFDQDLTLGSGLAEEERFSIVICDVPCTGSGTWARTPEQQVDFRDSKILEYVVIQRAILSNVVNHIDANGFLVYITCSVFEKENEENVQWLSQQYSLTVLSNKYINGAKEFADTMYVAVLQK
jgi:16S rRNA (cytosine967-C5)-methyltransferase